MFFSQFWRAPRSVGALLPSSRGLSAAMVAEIDFGSLATIVEFGPGTGIMTADVADRLRQGQRYLGIEYNKVFYERLNKRFSHLQFGNGSAVDLNGLSPADGNPGWAPRPAAIGVASSNRGATLPQPLGENF